MTDNEPASIDDIYLTPEELAVRHRSEVSTLANLRYRGEGIQFVKLPSGKVLYRMRDVLAAETAGYRAFSWARIASALEDYPGLKRGEAEKLLTHLRKAMKD